MVLKPNKLVSSLKLLPQKSRPYQVSNSHLGRCPGLLTDVSDYFRLWTSRNLELKTMSRSVSSFTWQWSNIQSLQKQWSAEFHLPPGHEPRLSSSWAEDQLPLSLSWRGEVVPLCGAFKDVLLQVAMVRCIDAQYRIFKFDTRINIFGVDIISRYEHFSACNLAINK